MSFWPFCVSPARLHLRQRRAIKPPIRCRAILRTAPAALSFGRRSRGSPKAARGRWKPVRAARLLKARRDKHLPACRRLLRDLPRPSLILPLLRGVEAKFKLCRGLARTRPRSPGVARQDDRAGGFRVAIRSPVLSWFSGRTTWRPTGRASPPARNLLPSTGRQCPGDRGRSG